jgi:hypothetical protein
LMFWRRSSLLTVCFWMCIMMGRLEFGDRRGIDNFSMSTWSHRLNWDKWFRAVSS